MSSEPLAASVLPLSPVFGGMLLIFLVAAVDAVRLLNHMRAENEILRDASLERSRRLASIRSYILLCDTARPTVLTNSHDALAQVLDNLAGYRAIHPGRKRRSSLKLRSLLEQHWVSMRAGSPSRPARSAP